MKITLEDVQSRFDDLISGEVAWSEVADYAASTMRADDAGLLIIEPDSSKTKIWNAIVYLSGVDLMGDEPGTYLHSVEDFIDYRKRKDI